MKKLPLVTLLILFSAPATAYVGPGLGMGVIGTILGVLTIILLAVFGLFWYPLKRALNKNKTASINSSNLHSDSHSAQSDKIVEHQPDDQTSGRPETFNPVTDPSTVKRTDSQVQ